MKTIRCPLHMGMISSRLPKPQYSPMKENTSAQINNFVRTPDKKQFKIKLRKSVNLEPNVIPAPVSKLLPTISEDPDMAESEAHEVYERNHLREQRRHEKLRGLNHRASDDCLTAIKESVNNVNQVSKRIGHLSA